MFPIVVACSGSGVDINVKGIYGRVIECPPHTLGLAVPSGVTLPTGAQLQDPSDVSSPIYIGDKPAVTDAPRVVHGEVKF